MSGYIQREDRLFDPATGQLVGYVDLQGREQIGYPVSKAGMPQGGVYLGASFPKRLRGGAYGRKVASWGALQNSAGTASVGAPASLGAPALTWADNATNILKLTQNATASFGQQNPIDGSQTYLPRGGTAGFSAGVWVYNPGARSLGFEVRLYNPNAAKSVAWNCAADPSSGWQFLTLSPSQSIIGSGFTFGTDPIGYVRVTQLDTGPEGAWLAGEVLYVSNVYVETRGRARFALTFDDGNLSQRYPGSTMRVSGGAYVSAVASNVFTTAAAHSLIVGEPFAFSPQNAGEATGVPAGITLGATYYVRTAPTSTTFTLATDAALTTQLTGITDTPSFTLRYHYAGTQERSAQQIVESYGFRGSLFIVPLWLGTSGRYGTPATAYMSADDVLAMWRDGWAVGSHSMTHPANNDSAGLRLLGPYGYYLSNHADNLPAQYLTAFGLTGVRRRVTAGTQASPSVFTTEAAHKFLLNQPIVFTDVAPTGCTLGVTYYVATTPTATTFTLATDQGTLGATVANTTGAWSGAANYRHPGSRPDDTAIYDDVVACAQALLAMGITTAYTFFALPQGGWDAYVRSALMRAGFRWIRGTAASGGTGAHTIAIGSPSGGGVGPLIPGGWLQQPDSLQTDGSFTALSAIDAFVSEGIVQGSCMCNYHHSVGGASLVYLDRLCQTLQTQSRAGNIDVVTLDELGKELGIL